MSAKLNVIYVAEHFYDYIQREVRKVTDVEIRDAYNRKIFKKKRKKTK